MASTQLIIHPAEIPGEGKALQGELDSSIFDLKDKLPKPKSPLRYDLLVSIVDGYLILQGSLTTTFELVCVLTTKPFDEEITLNPYLESIELEIGESLDLTEQLREDTLIALPAYPKAPGADAEADFSPSVTKVANEEKAGRRAEWDALDGLKTND